MFNLSTPSAGRVPASYVRLLFDYLAAQDVDATAILGEAAPGADQALSYSAAHWRKLLEQAAGHLDDAALGLRVGAAIGPAHLGLLGYALAASSSVPAALERYLRYQRLVHDVSPVRHALREDQLVLEWGEESLTLGLLVNQCGLAAVLQFARQITGVAVRPVSVDFVEPAPADVLPYEHYFQCPVRFGQDAIRVCFSSQLLTLPLAQPDASLAALLEQQVEALFTTLPERGDGEQAIRQRLARLLLQGEPGLDVLAGEMNMSGRTLRRRLESMGWNFRALLEDTRTALAKTYLQDRRLALPEIALLLGYSEQSAFSRAFLRWTGTTPKRWRNAQCLVEFGNK